MIFRRNSDFTTGLAAFFVFALVVGFFPASPYAQQTSPSPQAAKKPVKQPKIPAAVLSGLLAGTPEALLALMQYLAAVGGKPADVTARAIGVINQLKSSGLVKNQALIIATAQRIADAVRDTLSAAKVVQLKIDKNFNPPAGTIALDFGPADADTQKGFTRVLPNDPILKGGGQGIRRPGEVDGLLSDGVIGAKGVSLKVADGEYRVTLMTESLGDAASSLSPFGQNIVANGKKIGVMQATPENWLGQSVLSNKGEEGFSSTTARTGGAITLTVQVTNGKLDLQFQHGGAQNILKTYLTGMIVEPVEAPPLFTVPQDITPVTSAETILEQEAEVASSIAGLLEGAAPAAGPIAEDLPEPVVEPTQTASPS